MASTASTGKVCWADYEAVLFDLDGVLTDTARIHARCWQATFDAFLRRRADERGEAFEPFDVNRDYLRHVDGKPRYDGVRDFLASRDVRLPEGAADDPPDAATVCGVGNRKNELVRQAIERGEVEVYPTSVALVRRLRASGKGIALVSSSANAAAILRAAGLEGLFDVRVDGTVARERSLSGKPAPDTFLEAARELGVDPARAVVVEDAISGVQAGRDGGFGLVIGVARHDDADTLREHGAGVVVSDLAELSG